MAGKPDANAIGADRAYKTPEEASAAMDGTYRDAVASVPQDQLLPQSALPQGPDPMPFKLNPESASGGR